MDLQLLLTLGAVFLAVGTMAGAAAWYALAPLSGERRRIREVLAPAPSGLVIENPQVAEETDERWLRVARWAGKSPKDLNPIRRRLVRAGYRDIGPAVIYALSELVLPVLFAGVPLLWLGLKSGWIPALFFGFIGFLLPGLILGRLITERQLAISNGLSDALDLLVLCLEAGSSLDQAFVRASDELTIAYPDLAEEMRIVTSEMRAGKPRMDAFRDFAERTKVEDVRTLVSMLVQTDKFGTSISQALRTHSATGRSKRRQRAEEKAGRVGVKLVFPLVLCLFPAFYVVILGPAIIKFMAIFSAR